MTTVASKSPASVDRRFPDGFLWGTATAAYQIEGALDQDGRGASIWDSYAHTPGHIVDGSTAEVTVEHYHRYRDDVQLMKALGATAYRFSIAWPRIFPDGTGTPNPKGLDFYSRLVDELLANGIEPFATLYHWDLPQTLQDRFGGWQSRDTAQAFGDYAGYVAAQLSDRVKHFFTINEFSTFVELGHGRGIMAPGFKLPPAELNQVRHHAVLGHGLAVQAIRAQTPTGVKVGPAEAVIGVAPAIETPENIKAAGIAMRELNAGYLTVMLEGRYTDAFLATAGADAPKFTDEDLKAIGSPLDFVGTNIYWAHHLVQASEQEPGFEFVPYQPTHPQAHWPGVSAIALYFTPESMYWGTRLLVDLWDVDEIYITEHGGPFTHEADAEGVHGDLPGGVENDSDRVVWTRAYLAQLQRATAEGIPVRGYFHWSLLDNWEWVAGRRTRFGLYRVNYETQERTPKLSAHFYRACIATNAVA
jgi:beta-glucosidase